MTTAATPPEGIPAANGPAAPKPTSRIAVISESVLQAAAQVMTSGDKETAGTVKGSWFKNLSAAAVVFWGFYLLITHLTNQSREERVFSQEQSREDRKMFKDGLLQMHDDSNRKWTAITANQTVLLDTAKVMQSLQTATGEIASTLKAHQQTTAALGEAVKELRSDLRRGGLVKPKPPEPESRGGEVLPLPRETGG